MTYSDESADLEQIADYVNLIAPTILDKQECPVCQMLRFYKCTATKAISSCKCNAEIPIETLIDLCVASMPQCPILVTVYLHQKGDATILVAQGDKGFKFRLGQRAKSAAFLNDAVDALKRSLQQYFLAQKGSRYVFGFLVSGETSGLLAQRLFNLGIGVVVQVRNVLGAVSEMLENCVLAAENCLQELK